jgi:putative phage-type endonuclease
MALTEEEAKMIGGSDLAGILGLSPWSTPLSVYARVKAGQWDAETSPAMRRGTLMEPVVRAMYKADTNSELLGPQLLRHPRLAYGRASLDDVAVRGGARRVLELKTDGRADAARWGTPGTDEVPDYYLPQAHYYLGTALEVGAVDVPEADVAVLLLGVDDSPRIYTVTHDPDVYAWLLEGVERFWHDHVLPSKPPAPTMPAREADAVRRLFRAEREPLVPFHELPPDGRATVLAYAEARRAEKAAKDTADAAELRLKLALGWRAGVDGMPPDSGLQRVTWTADKQGRISWKDAYDALARETGAARELVQSLAEQHRSEPGRTLRATETKETE